MSQVETPVGSSIVAVYHDHADGREGGAAAPRGGVRDGRPLDHRPRLPDERGAGRLRQRRRLRQGRGRDRGVVRRSVRPAGRRGVPVVPGVGPVVVAGPLAAAVLAGLEGAIAGTALGSLAGALVGWGIPKERALTYETQIKGGKFLVVGPRRPGGHRARPGPARPPHAGDTWTSTSRRRRESAALPGPTRLPAAAPAAGRPASSPGDDAACAMDSRRRRRLESRSRMVLVRITGLPGS